MERLNTNVGAIDTALQQRPEILKAVGVDATVDILDGVIDDLVGIVAGESFIREQEVSVEGGTRFDVLADLSLKDGLSAALDDHGTDLSATLKDAHDSHLVFSASAGDAALTNAQVHVASLAADEGLVRFNLRPAFAAQFHQGTALHGETNTVEHEPRSGLSDAKATGKFAGRYAVLAVSNNPNRRKPLLKAERRVLKNGSNLGGELTLSVSALALPFLLVRKPRDITSSASGADDAVGPNLRRHVGDALVGVGEVNDCFSKSGGAAHEARIGALS